MSTTKRNDDCDVELTIVRPVHQCDEGPISRLLSTEDVFALFPQSPRLYKRVRSIYTTERDSRAMFQKNIEDERIH